MDTINSESESSPSAGKSQALATSCCWNNKMCACTDSAYGSSCLVLGLLGKWCNTSQGNASAEAYYPSIFQCQFQVLEIFVEGTLQSAHVGTDIQDQKSWPFQLLIIIYWVMLWLGCTVCKSSCFCCWFFPFSPSVLGLNPGAPACQASAMHPALSHGFDWSWSLCCLASTGGTSWFPGLGEPFQVHWLGL